MNLTPNQEIALEKILQPEEKVLWLEPENKLAIVKGYLFSRYNLVMSFLILFLLQWILKGHNTIVSFGLSVFVAICTLPVVIFIFRKHGFTLLSNKRLITYYGFFKLTPNSYFPDELGDVSTKINSDKSGSVTFNRSHIAYNQKMKDDDVIGESFSLVPLQNVPEFLSALSKIL